MNNTIRATFLIDKTTWDNFRGLSIMSGSDASKLIRNYIAEYVQRNKKINDK